MNTKKNTKNLTAGDFTGLAKNYGLYRPDYSQTILNALLALISPKTIADVGAGTGIWTRMITNTLLGVDNNNAFGGGGVL